MSTRIGIVADLHYTNPKIHPGELHNGISPRLRGMLDVLEAAVRTFNLNVVLVAGDLFDSSRPLHVVSHYVMDRLHRGAFESVRVYAMPGNHDADSNAVHDNVLAPFEHSEGFTPIHSPMGLFDHIFVVPWGYHPLGLTPPAGCDIVVAHHGIWDDQTPSFLRNTKDAVAASEIRTWMRQHGVQHYLAGDWHEHRRFYDDSIVQIGALTPQDWRNPGINGYGTVVILDDLTWSPRYVVMAGPRFVVADAASALPKLPPGCSGYARVKVKDRETVPGYVVIEETGGGDEHIAQAERAAVDVATPESLGASLEEWVLADAQIPLEDRPEVYRRAMAFLSEGRKA